MRKLISIAAVILFATGGVWAQKVKRSALNLELTSEPELTTGSQSACTLAITNSTRYLMVVTSITFPDNERMAPISFLGTVYGGISYRKDEDAYHYNSMVQRETGVPFCYGIVFPGTTRMVSFSVLPFAAEEKLVVHYVMAQGRYYGKEPNWSPLEIYVAETNAGYAVRYVRAGADALDSLEPEPVIPYGRNPGASGKHVIIGNLQSLKEKRAFYTMKAREGIAFAKDKAQKAVERLMPGHKFSLHYISRLSCYLVEPQDAKAHCFLLESADQLAPGGPLPHEAKTVVELLENPVKAQLRVGDKQEGIGPGGQPAGRKFFDREVYYGDGMYTQGEFIEVAEGDWRDILARISRQGASIRKCHYYFQSFYYEMKVAENR